MTATTPTYYYDWEKKRDTLVWFDNGGLNIAYNALDKHIEDGNGHIIALIYEDDEGKTTQFDFFQLVKRSNQVANYLTHLGVKKGENVCIYLPRIPELYFTFFGIIKIGAVAGVFFSGLEKEVLYEQLRDSKTTTLITNTKLLPTIQEIKHELGSVHLIVIDDERIAADMALEPEHGKIAHTKPFDEAVIHYNTQQTEQIKGILYSHYGMVQQIESAKAVFELEPNDIYWCTADPGWITGIVYGMLANLAIGVTTLIYEGQFSPEKWYEIVDKYRVTTCYTSPHILHMLKAKGTDVAKQFDLTHIKALCSVGESLSPDIISFGEAVFGIKIRDTWWEPETGSIIIANTPSTEIKPGSIGKPLPWINVAILDDNGNTLPVGEEGRLAIEKPWPSMMQAIFNLETAYNAYFSGNWYLTRAKAKRDSDGYYWLIA